MLASVAPERRHPEEGFRTRYPGDRVAVSGGSGRVERPGHSLYTGSSVPAQADRPAEVVERTVPGVRAANPGPATSASCTKRLAAAAASATSCRGPGWRPWPPTASTPCRGCWACRPRRAEPDDDLPTVEEHVVTARQALPGRPALDAGEVAAFDQDPCRAERWIRRASSTMASTSAERRRRVGQHGRLPQVGRDHQGMGKEPLPIGGDAVGVEQRTAGGGDHDRVDHQPGQLAGGGAGGHHVDRLGGAEHARLDRRDGEVVEHGGDLGIDHLGRDEMDGPDRGRVLGGDGGDGRGGKTPRAAIGSRSAWMPAPDPESEPAMVRATGGLPSVFTGRSCPRRSSRPRPRSAG